MLDKIIFGDNQFLGINHRSIDKSKDQEDKYGNVAKIYETLEYVNVIGIKSFMFTTHDQFEPVFQKIKSNTNFSDFKLIPCIPYAHKYATAMFDLGVYKSIKKFLPGNIILSGLRGAKSLISADTVSTMQLLVDSEMKMLKGMNVQAIFLQNVITDLLIGLKMYDLFYEFVQYVEKRYKIKAGFITMNYTKLTDILINSIGMNNPIICSNINKIGFRMNPSQKQVESKLKQNNSYNIAMSILASGAIPPKDAVTYIKSIDGVDSVLFGASNHSHIKETYKLLDTIL